MCRHGEHCRYQTKCMYNHEKYDSRNRRTNSKTTDDEIKSLEEEIIILKAKVSKHKSKKKFRVEALARGHLLDREDVK